MSPIHDFGMEEFLTRLTTLITLTRALFCFTAPLRRIRLFSLTPSLYQTMIGMIMVTVDDDCLCKFPVQLDQEIVG